MELIFLWKFVHMLAACVLLGAGLGIAFFVFAANRTDHPGVIAVTVRIAVVANLIFIIAGMVVLPLSGWALARAIGVLPLEESWIVLSTYLYLFVALCWLPVVFILFRMRNLARDAAMTAKSLPDEYRRLFVIWFCLGWPALAAVVAIFVLMVWQPRVW
jgi:uncharacterized membrane protein